MQEQIQKIIGEFRKQFTRDDGLLDIDKYAHDEIEDFITKVYQSGREDEKLEVLEEIEEMEIYDTKNNWCAGFLKALDTLKTKLQAKDIEQ